MRANGWSRLAERRREAEVLELLERGFREGVPMGGGAEADGQDGAEVYESVEDYDPVLRWHCRL